MSSSSEAAHTTENRGLLPSEHQWIVRLLRAMKMEWANLAGSIAELGATLSQNTLSNEAGHLVREMQAFDALSQRAFAQFRVLDRICQELGASGVETTLDIEGLVGELPFLDMRRWYLAALKGEEPAPPQSEEPPDEKEPVLWFE